MKIRTHYDPPPIPQRCFDWSAIDYDTYSGEDTDLRGWGTTEAEAIADLEEQIEEAKP